LPAAGFARLSLPGADVRLLAELIPVHEAGHLISQLISATPWRTDEIRLWGKRYLQPRQVAWYGDAGCRYTYSGVTLEPSPWTPLLAATRDLVQQACGATFNSVLLNYYRDQHDSMGLHSDDEPELGPQPVIASLSLGEERVLTFKARAGRPAASYRLPLPSGSLLLMQGDTQRNWKHGVAKSRRPLGPRVNLTFRCILGVRQPGSLGPCRTEIQPR
jgi:alkylated DNA repair dioxygenase AlkB